MQKHKHKKALKAAALVSGIFLLPLLYIAYLYHNNARLDTLGMGVVPDFAYTFVNDPIGITHFDTEIHPLLIFVLKDACQAGPDGAMTPSCRETLSLMEDIKVWVSQHIKVPQRNVSNPRPVRLVAMLEGPYDMIPAGWNIVAMSEGMSYLVPGNRKTAEYPAAVLVDDSSFFRGYVPSSHPEAFDKVTRELSRIVSNQYLLHYLTQQSLMWEKRRGRAEAAPSDDSH